LIARPWRYTALASRVVEYRVEQPRWRIWPGANWKLDPDVFGPEFSEILHGQKLSAFIADGSPVRVLARR
jgi:hypothetical protein